MFPTFETDINLVIYKICKLKSAKKNPYYLAQGRRDEHAPGWVMAGYRYEKSRFEVHIFDKQAEEKIMFSVFPIESEFPDILVIINKLRCQQLPVTSQKYLRPSTFSNLMSEFSNVRV